MNMQGPQSYMFFLRLGASGVTCITALYGPWWLFFTCIFIFAFCFPWFIEGVIAALFHDVLYGVGLTHFFGIDILMTIVAFFSMVCGLFIRRSVRVRERDHF